MYYFQTAGGVGLTTEPVEVELDGLHDAQLEAVGFMGEHLRSIPEKFWHHEEATVTVTDDTGLTLFTLSLTAYLAPVVRTPPKPA